MLTCDLRQVRFQENVNLVIVDFYTWLYIYIWMFTHSYVDKSKNGRKKNYSFSPIRCEIFTFTSFNILFFNG